MKNSATPNEPSDKLWTKQFRKSLSSWAHLVTDSHGAEPYNKHLELPGEILQKVFTGRRPSWRTENKGKKLEWEERGEITQTFFNALLVQQMDAWLEGMGGFDMLLDTLDSEIEVAMLFGLIICARDQWMGVDVKFTHPSFSDHPSYLDFSTRNSWRDSLEIEPQARLGEYRVDFLLTFTGERPVPALHVEGETQTRHQELRPIQKKMIVECDGHDFHEKTKEQAKRDKSRDRTLQSLGFPVYHYTGSEIWKDVFGSAAQIIRDLTGNHPQNLIDSVR